MIDIAITDEQRALTVDLSRIRTAIESILRDAGMSEAEVSVGIIDDARMHELNRMHLNHDYPTDVLSFVLDRTESTLDGEVIVSTETAIAQAREFNQTPEDELLLYVIHGALHLVGYDDKELEKRAEMRKMENYYMNRFARSYNAE
ncbi:MAG: rRNA maturation RNase YbeY [Planctomycetales bacterium]|nr:rRNA maturation RNase YbeY [Planctomycetales bacterium]